MTRAHCPVGELAGDPHTYVAGDGVVIPWDVAGDPRPGVECCRECAKHSADPVADYLRENGYATIDDWAADSDYVRNDDGEWCDDYGSFDVRARLLSVIEERRLSDE